MKDMDEITIIGTISKTASGYVVSTDDGIEYGLSAILPWEAVPTDFGSVGFEMHLGKRLKISGLTDGNTIYGARLTETE
jgi:hypothetical protein